MESPFFFLSLQSLWILLGILFVGGVFYAKSVSFSSVMNITVSFSSGLNPICL